MDVSHRGVRHGASGALGLDGVALRGPVWPHGAAVKLGFLEVSLRARRWRWGRVPRLGPGRHGHVGVLGDVGILRAR